MATTISTSPEVVDSIETTSLLDSESSIIITSLDEPDDAQIMHQVTGKHQMLPLVYIQAPSKITPVKSTNVTFNTVPTLQKQNMFTNIGSQSLLIGKQPLLLSKPPNLQHVPKNGVTYFTMVNPAPNIKPADTNINTTNRQPITTIKNIMATPNPNANASQKYILSSMPKLTSNRLPVTATTNSVQPKISFMPMAIPSKSKVYNFKIADGQIQAENKAMAMMSDRPLRREPVAIRPKETNRLGLYCDEVIDIDSTEKKEEKSYQLSIIEDSNSRNDAGFTISINEDEDKSKFNFRETPKFSKHGVSILKKTYSFLDRKEKPKSPKLSFKSITTISDTSTKEVKITSEQGIDQTPPVKKNERRRKSTICLRKDYDDNEVDQDRPRKMPKLEMIKEIILPKDRNLLMVSQLGDINQEDEIKTEAVDEVTEIKQNLTYEDDYDIVKSLHWEDGIGTLPGSELKFRLNEFSFIEYLTKDEFRKIIYRKQSKAREIEKKRIDAKEEMRCLECGCFGMPSEFISPKYCSCDCQNAGQMKEAMNKYKKMKKKRDKQERPWLKPHENGSMRDSKSSEDDNNTSNENSQDKFNYPWHCSKKGFLWAKYLDHIKAKSAPTKLFSKDPFPYCKNGFRPGMKLEGIDPQHPSYFCVLTVSEVQGYRVRMHFDGYSENYDFWVNADSMDIFQAGYCEKHGHTLHPPPGYETTFNWNYYLKLTHSPAAPKHLFANRLANNAVFINGFRTGMKLEAVDRKNTALVCVSTIRDMMDNRILVHFDSWDDIYDYWADPTSPYIHPVGWCDQNGHNLTPPNGYPNPETFTWERYLKETKSVGAPVRAFKQRPACGFKKGMRLECVDRRVPHIIRVANVDDVKDHQIRISFDGWPDRYSYWVDDDSTNIHPATWCQKSGHPLELPLTPDDVYDFLECPTVGCRGQGHICGPKFARHSTQKNCPYADENIDQEKIVPDRLLSPTRQIEAAVPVSREPRENSKTTPTKFQMEPAKMEWNGEDETKTKQNIKLIKCKIEPSPENTPYDKKPRISHLEEDLHPEEVKMREKHSSYLHNYIGNEVDPCEWTCAEVAYFVRSLPCCRIDSDLFRKNNIDGISFLMLTQNDLVEILNCKLGPAITLYNCILLLRKDSMQCI